MYYYIRDAILRYCDSGMMMQSYVQDAFDYITVQVALKKINKKQITKQCKTR